MLFQTSNQNRFGSKPKKGKKKKRKSIVATNIPTLPPTVSAPDMTTYAIFYSSYTQVSPGATMGQNRPVFPQTTRIEEKVSVPEIDAITDRYIQQVFPLEYTLRMLRVSANYSASPSESTSDSKIGVSGRIKAAFDEVLKFAGAETEVGVNYEQSIGSVVRYFNNEKRIQDISFEIVRLNGIYQKQIAEVKVKDPFSGNITVFGAKNAKDVMQATNDAIRETLTIHFNYIQSQLNALRGQN